MKFSKRTPVNLLDLVPTRSVGFTVGDDNLVTLVIPRFKRDWLRRLFVPKRKGPNVNIALDRFGSRVWHECDGITPVGRIADALHAEFGEDVDPAHERVAVFMKQLAAHGFISLEAVIPEPSASTTEAHPAKEPTS